MVQFLSLSDHYLYLKDNIHLINGSKQTKLGPKTTFQSFLTLCSYILKNGTQSEALLMKR